MIFQRFLVIVRGWSLPISISSATLGTLLAARDGQSSVSLYALVLLGSSALHASANAFNDYFDFKNKVDSPGSPTVLYRPHGLFEGWLSDKTLLRVAIGCLGLGLVIGGTLAWCRTAWLWPILLAGVFLNIFYTGLRRYSLKYIAMGETAVFLAFGPLLVTGSYAVQTRHLSWQVLLLSLPTGILTALILFANNLRDRESDSLNNIKTLATLMTPRAGKRLFATMATLPYALVCVYILTGRLGSPAALVFASVGTLIKSIRVFWNGIPHTADVMMSRVTLLFNFFLLSGITMAGLLNQ